MVCLRHKYLTLRESFIRMSHLGAVAMETASVFGRAHPPGSEGIRGCMVVVVGWGRSRVAQSDTSYSLRIQNKNHRLIIGFCDSGTASYCGNRYKENLSKWTQNQGKTLLTKRYGSREQVEINHVLSFGGMAWQVIKCFQPLQGWSPLLLRCVSYMAHEAFFQF